MPTHALPQTLEFPLPRAAEARRGRRSPAGRLLGAARAAVPARPRQSVPRRGRRGPRADRHRHRRSTFARRLGGADRRAARGAQADAADRHPFPSRSHRPCRLALRALRHAARHEPDRISPRPQHPARPVGAEVGALSRLLSLAWADRGEHRDPARQRPAISAHGRHAAENLPAAAGGRPADDRRPDLRRC